MLESDLQRWSRRDALRTGAAVGLSLAAGGWGSSAQAADAGPAKGDGAAAEGGIAPVDRWAMFRGDDFATGVSAVPLAPPLEVVWQRDFPDGGFEGAAAIQDGVVYVGSLPTDGGLYALDLKTGEQRWKLPNEGGWKAAPSLRNGLLYCGDDSGVFHAVDQKTGDVVWKHMTDAEIISSATFYKDRVLFGSYDQNLYCLNAKSGDLVWKFAIEGPVHSTPTVVVDRAFCAGCDSKLHIIDLEHGKEIASLEVNGQAGATPAVQGDTLYLGNLTDSFFAIDWKKPEIRWTYTHPTRKFAYYASAAVWKDFVIVAGRDKMVKGLDRATGKDLWIFNCRGRVDSSPVVAGGLVWVGSDDGRLYCLDPATGKKQWEFDSGAKVAASPAVAQDRLVFGNDKGSLFCLKNKG